MVAGGVSGLELEQATKRKPSALEIWKQKHLLNGCSLTVSLDEDAKGATVKLNLVDFKRNVAGSVSLIFALSTTLLVTAGALGIDYSRLSNVRSSLQSALDAALLVVGKDYLETGRKVQNDEFSRLVSANLPAALAPLAQSAKLTFTNDKVTGGLNGDVQLTFGKFLGSEKLKIDVQASVPLGATRLELALVLDTTGSMGQLGKMDALKKAANELIDTLEAEKKIGSTIAYSVVPFATQVRVPTSTAGASWIDFRTSEVNPMHNASVSSWDGCIMDRDKPFNSKKDAPDVTRREQKHPAQNCVYTGVQEMLPLSTNVPSVRLKINALTPNGNTNTTIGMAWGYNVLTSGNPLGDSASSDTNRTVKVIVFLTDGLNTEDRYGNATANIDADMRQLCTSAKTKDIRVFTIRVIEGNDALLRDCATTPADFFSTNEAAGINAAFKSIAGQLTRLRLSS